MPPSVRSVLAVVSASALALAGSADAAPIIRLEVDATDLPRNLARATMTIDVPTPLRASGGPLDLHYVLWSPGNHTPSGPIENLVDLAFADSRGQPIAWRRDPERMHVVTLALPPATDHVHASLAYIAGQPNNNSRSTDTYGRRSLGVLNWNTVVLYPLTPGSPTNQTVRVAASLVLPSQWAFATALRTRTSDGEPFGLLRELDPGRPVNAVSFEEVPLAELIDSPVIMGRHMRSYPLAPAGFEHAPPHRVTVVAPEDQHTKISDWMLADLSEMVRQHFLLFQRPDAPPFPREAYEFLLIADGSMGFAVEHAESTLTTVALKAFSDAKQDDPGDKAVKGGGADLTVLAHEYFHAWCGKLAAPEGLVRDDFSTPARTELLWVYEGLTTYYESVLACRGGMTTFEEFKDDILTTAVTLQMRTGRLWRSVEDTAVAARMLRQRGLYWYDRRRGQEYYSEGAMFWMEADARIRRETAGLKSLDDVCRHLLTLPVQPVGSQATYTRSDVVRALAHAAPATDWETLIQERIERPQRSLDLSPLLRLTGWEVLFAEEPTPEQKKLQADDDGLNLRPSLGLRLDKNAEIIDIVPDGPADAAGLAYGMKVVAIDGWEYTKDRLKTAVKESPNAGAIDFTVTFGGRVDTLRVPYALGPRVPRLVRLEGEPDILSEIVKPR